MTKDNTVGAANAAPTGTSRRLFLGAGLAGVGAAALAGGSYALGASSRAPSRADSTPLPDSGEATLPFGPRELPFYGVHQPGITSQPAAFASFVALDLHAQTDRKRLRSWMRLITDDAARLMEGKAALADVEPEVAASPAGLAITVGFGREFVLRAGGEAPPWLAPLPTFSIDRLEERYSGGDALLIVQADDPLALAHALRVVMRDSLSLATVRWRQDGFRRARGVDAPGTTMRNLFGQLDGTANFAPGSADFDKAVWAADEAPAWLRGGTSFVFRRIAMDLDRWDGVDRGGRENAVGRTLSTGAPLSGGSEHSPLDLDARGPHGLPVIAGSAHVRRAFVADPRLRIVRMGYNYQQPASDADALSDSGLLFGSWQADVTTQFIPIQRALDQADLLNTWTTPVGSAVFAMPPGCGDGSYLGRALLD